MSEPIAKENGTSSAQDEAKPQENDAGPPVPEMRTVALVGFGGIKMVKVYKEPEIRPKEGEVLIRVKAW